MAPLHLRCIYSDTDTPSNEFMCGCAIKYVDISVGIISIEVEQHFRMTTLMKKLPGVSLGILLAGYCSLGYLLSSWTVPWVVWLVVVSLALIQAALLSSMPQGSQQAIGQWMRSDIGSFTIIIGVAFAIAIILVWFHIFQYVLMILAAEVLARVELMNAGFRSARSLGILTAVSLLGLASGWSMSYLY